MRRTWKRVLACSLLSICIAQAADAAGRDAARSPRSVAARHGRVVAVHPPAPPAAKRHASTVRSNAAHGPVRRLAAQSHPAPTATAHRAARPARNRQLAAAPPRDAAQQGHASIYSRRFAGRRMADGGRFDPRSDSVASRTLPLGTQARVTNLRNGRSAIVRVRDRGPHIRGRILDVSPGVAERLGMMEAGIAPIRVVALMGGDAPAVAPRANAAGPSCH